jgi:hypothetical protein
MLYTDTAGFLSCSQCTGQITVTVYVIVIRFLEQYQDAATKEREAQVIPEHSTHLQNYITPCLIRLT